MSGHLRSLGRHFLAATAGVAAISVAFVAQAAPPPAAPPPVHRLQVGIAYGDTLVWQTPQQLASSLDDAVAVGATVIRADLSWADVQWDSPSVYQWTNFDRVVAAARARHLSVLPVLAYTPPWARPAGCGTQNCGPADPAEFAAFANAAARRYAGQGLHTWEVWNEENITTFWAPHPDPTAYAGLLIRTSIALRMADAGAYVIMGGLASVTTSGGNISQTDFLTTASRAGANKYVNAIGYHPYTYPYLASFNAPWGSPWNIMETTKVSLRSVLIAQGTPKMPIWITEFGAPTGGPGAISDGQPASITASTTHVTEARQAQIAADVIATANASPLVQGIAWYADRDPVSKGASTEDFFGMRRADGSAKPAMAQLRLAIAKVTQ